MRILHIASFMGNVGDNASHLGLAAILNRFLGDYTVEPIEIRRFYRNYRRDDRRRFDADLIRYANTFDLVVIGGGAFLDYWVPDSATGTTLDLDPMLVGTLRARTLITSVGCNPRGSIPDGNLDKARRFFDALGANPQVRVAVRNDGSIRAIRRDLGAQYATACAEILDHGFFYTQREPAVLSCGRPYVAINIVLDQLGRETRPGTVVDPASFYLEIKRLVEHLIRARQLDVMFIPHIYHDLTAIAAVLATLDDFDARNHVTVAPYRQGPEGARLLFALAHQATAVVGCRFHANVCNLAGRRPTVGLAVLERVDYLFRSLGLEANVVTPGPGFSGPAGARLDALLAGAPYGSFATLEQWQQRTLDFYQRNLP